MKSTTTLIWASAGALSLVLALPFATAQNLGQAVQNTLNNWAEDNNVGNWDQAQRATPDARFVFDAARRTLTAMREAEMAQRNSEDSGVRELAERMARENRKAYDRLQEIAQRRGFSLPTRPHDDQRDELRKLSEASGDHFDREFAHDEASNEERIVHLFEKEIDEGQDHEFQAYARQGLPMLRENLRRARDLEHGY